MCVIDLKDIDRRLNIDSWKRYYASFLQGARALPVDLAISAQVRLIRTFWRGPSNFTLLEVGCGTARFSLVFAREGAAVVGVDVVKEALLLAKSIFREEGVKAEFICADMAYLPFRNGAFDVIFGAGSIEHAKDTSSVVTEVARTLSKKGIFAATVPLVSLSVVYLVLRGTIPDIPLIRHLVEFLHFRLLKNKFKTLGYEKAFTERGIRKIFSSAGLTNIETGVFDIEHPITLFNDARIKNLLNKLAHLRPFWPFIFIKGEKIHA